MKKERDNKGAVSALAHACRGLASAATPKGVQQGRMNRCARVHRPTRSGIQLWYLRNESLRGLCPCCCAAVSSRIRGAFAMRRIRRLWHEPKERRVARQRQGTSGTKGRTERRAQRTPLPSPPPSLLSARPRAAAALLFGCCAAKEALRCACAVRRCWLCRVGTPQQREKEGREEKGTEGSR
jgi:hypothetical protein